MSEPKTDQMAKCIVENGELSFDIPVDVLRQLGWDADAMIDWIVEEESKDDG